MDIVNNLDLLSVGIAIAATGVLGFAVFFSNKKSITNRTFLYFSLITILWSVVNYLNYRLVDPTYGLILIRLTVFLGLFHAFFFFQLFTVFPNDTYPLSKRYRFILIPYAVCVAALTLTPLIFTKAETILETGRIVKVQNGPLLPLYGLTVIALIIGGLIRLIIRDRKATGELRRQYNPILLGTALTFSLLITFNLVLPAFFSIPKFIPFGALFLFPFIVLTSYTILKRKLFSVKVASTAVLVFILSVALFLEIIYTDTLSLIIFRSGVFVLVLIYGISLIKGVYREIEQKEKLQLLSHQLEESNEKLKGLDKLKTEFLSLASHQLRSPLTAIKGYASMMDEGALGKLTTEQDTAAKRIYASAQGLVNLVEDLLNVSKIEQGGMKYEMMPVDLAKVVQELAGEMKIPAENKGLELRVTIPANDAFTVSADPVKIKQVFLNLVDNSIKYTATGFVEIGLKRGPNREAQFVVRDSGVGITPETKAKLFQKFSRGGEGSKMNTGGSGLGLYLAQEIAKAHNGDITVDSEGLGKGTVFTVSLPAA